VEIIYLHIYWKTVLLKTASDYISVQNTDLHANQIIYFALVLIEHFKPINMYQQRDTR